MSSWTQKIDRLNPDRDKQKNPSYESSSRTRKPGLRKPKQKNPSYESSSRIRKPGLRKPKQKNPSHESSSRIRKARWINKDMAGALESQTNTFWVCWQGRRCNERKRRGFYTALVACAPISQSFFFLQNCPKIVFNQVSRQAKSWAYAAIPGCSSIASITCLGKLCNVQFGTYSGLKESFKIYARNVNLQYMLSHTFNMHWYTIICRYMHNMHYMYQTSYF